jgi:HSP20 family protein
MMRWDPFDEFGTLRRSMDRLFDEFFTGRGQQRGAGRELATIGWEPAVEMFEDDHAVVVRAELPNIDPKRVEVTVTNESVTLKGETRFEQEQHTGRSYHRRELRYGSFSRTLPLRTEVQSADAKATYKDGVLEITLPKSERVRPTSVKVQVGE